MSDAPTTRDAGPTLRSEFWRGLSAYNLAVGALGGLLLGAAAGAATRLGWVADLLELGPAVQAVAAAVLGFAAVTAAHTAAHAACGARIEAGLAAARAGAHALAVRRLAFLDRVGMDHYDEAGVARAALAVSRAELEKSSRGQAETPNQKKC